MIDKNILAAGAAAICLGLLSAPTMAEGIYFGASIGEANARDFDASTVDAAFAAQGLATSATSLDNTHSAWKGFVGYRLLRYFAIEGSYVGFGKFSFDALTVNDPGAVSGTFKAQDVNVAAVGLLPLGEHLTLMGKVGMGYWDVKREVSGIGAGTAATNESAHGFRPVFGLGAQVPITEHVAIRGEWESFQAVGDTGTTGKSDIDVWSLGLQYSF